MGESGGMHNFINLFFDLLRHRKRDFDKKVFHRQKTAEKSYPHLFSHRFYRLFSRLAHVLEFHGNVNDRVFERVFFKLFVAAVVEFL